MRKNLNIHEINGRTPNKKHVLTAPILILLSIVIFFLSINCVSAAEWNVTPGGSIQTAINNAGENDTINVQTNGSEYTYQENVIVNKTGLIITTEGGVIVQAANPNNPVFTLNTGGSGSTIQNFRINGATGMGSTGILLEGTTNCNILYNTINGNAEGITLIGSTHNTIYANIIEYNYGTGMLLAFSPENNLTGNSLYYNGCGISLDMSGNNILRSNEIRNYYYSETRGYNFGVSGYAEDYIQDIDTSNTINWNSIYYLVGQNDQTLEYIYGGYLALVNCNNITIYGSSAYYNDKGIVLVNTNNSNIDASNFYNNIDGIYLLDSSYNTIKNNAVYNNYDLKKKEKSGIHLENSHNNTIFNNNVHDNNVGLSLIMSSGNLFYNNPVYNNFETGIWVLGSNSNTLIGNKITGSPLGLDLRGFSNDNLIYNNNFSNTIQAMLEPGSTGNQFNLGEPYGGNFWANYNGTNRGDGIGSTPYYFSGGQDNLPYVSTVLNVFPGDSIQNTINSAFSGNIILIHDNNGSPYTYVENLEINKKLNLRPLSSVTIQAADMSRPVISIVSGGDQTMIMGFTITGSTDNGVGIALQSVSNCNITGNNITNNRDGIAVWDGNNNTFSNNNITNSTVNGISIAGSANNTLKNNTISGSQRLNLYVVDWGNISHYYQDIDISNTADGKPIYYLRNRSGETYIGTPMGYLALVECTNMNLSNLNITHSGDGALLVATNGSTIQNCNFSNNGYGVRLEMSSSGNNIIGNNLTGCVFGGIQLRESDNNSLTNNTVANNDFGIVLTDSIENTLSGNTITNSSWQNFSVDTWIGDINAYFNTILNSNTINGAPIRYLRGMTNQIIDGNLLSTGYIALVQCSNIVVQNLNILKNGQGILMVGCNNITLLNSTFTDNGDGIKLFNTTHSTINGNIVNGTLGSYYAGSGIGLESSSGNLILNNSIENTGSGIGLRSASNNNTLNNNTATNIQWGALNIIQSTGNILRNTTLTTTGEGTQINIMGTQLTHYYQDIDTSNTIDGKPIYYLRNRSGETYEGTVMGYLGMVECNNMTIRNIAMSHVVQGILMVATNNSTIEYCTLSYNTEGIFLWGSSNNHILNNDVHHNIAEGRQSGIHLENGSNYNEIRDNNVYENEAGIVILGSNGNTIISNNVYNNWYDGIRVDQNSLNNTIHRNDVNSNTGGSGIVIDGNSQGTIISGNEIRYNSNGLSILNGSCDNTVVGNTVEDNYYGMGYGVEIRENSHNNLIYNNNIYNNNVQAFVESGCNGNLFNKPEWVGGNYWNSYSSDRGDGFGTSPYIFSGGQDNLPYAGWYELYNVFPGENIQNTINNIYYGGTVLVHDNFGQAYNYTENIYINAPEWYQYYNRLRVKADGDVTVSAADPTISVFSIGPNGSYTTIQGFKINGATQTYSAGVAIWQAYNNKVLNNTIFGNVFGIAIGQSNSTNVSGNTVYNNTEHGINLWDNCDNNIISNNSVFDNEDTGIGIGYYSENNQITDNYAYRNGGQGISVAQYSNYNLVSGNAVFDNNYQGMNMDTYSNYNLITQNRLYNNDHGILLWNNCNSNIIANNTAQNNSYNGITVGNYCNNNTVINNTVTNNNDVGINFDQANGNFVNNNTVTNNGGTGINNWLSHNNTINYNNVTNNGVTQDWGPGINIGGDPNQGLYSEENQINNNYVAGNRNFGIHLSDSNNNTVNGNTIENNGWGFENWAELKLYFANNNIISNNIIFNNVNDHGISMHNATGNLIENNQITNATRGIDIYEQSNNNQFTSNIVTNSIELGIYARDSTGNTYISNQMSGGSSRLQIFADPGVLISNNIISNLDWYGPDNQQSGIDLGESPGSFIINNIITNTGGITLWLTDGTLIENNTLTNCTTNGIGLQQSSATIIGNNLINSGISLAASPECTLTNNNITTTSSESRTLEVQTWNDDINDFRQYIDASNTINGKPIHYILDANNLLIDITWNIGYLALVQSNNVIVHGINMNNTGWGIFLAGTNNTTIGGYLPGEACAFINNDVGIELWKSYNNNIINNILVDNEQGILIRSNTGNANNTLEGNILTNNLIGILINKSGMNNLSNNNITSNSTNARNFGVEAWGEDVSISDFRQNIGTSNLINGKSIYYIMDVSNLIINNSLNPGYLGLVHCNNVTINGLNMTNNGQGILLAGTTNSTIGGNLPGEANNFNNNNQGIYLFWSSGNHITNNQLSDNTNPQGSPFGIQLSVNSDNNTITSNNLSGNGIGIAIEDSYYNTISNNVLTKNFYNGIIIGAEFGGSSDFYTGGVNNIILNNIINSTLYTGLSITNSPNNHIINNTITNTCNTTDPWAADWEAALTIVGANSTLVSGNQIINNPLSGIYIYDLDWQNAYSQNNQIISNNISGNSVGIRVDSDSSTNLVNFNRIVGNTDCQLRYAGSINTLDATNNWWGSNSAPVNGPGEQIEGMVNYSPWLYLTFTADPTLITIGSTSTLTASFNNACDGTIITPIDPTHGHLPDGCAVTFTTDLGSVGSDTTTKNTSNGIAIATLTADEGTGTANLITELDNQTLYTIVNVVEKFVINNRTHTSFNSIQEAINDDYTSNGDTIIVSGAGFLENIYIWKQLFIIAQGVANVQPANTGLPVFRLLPDGSGSTIQGFFISGGSFGIYFDNANNCNIIENTIQSNGEGIFIQGDSDNNTINHNIIKNNTWNGIIISGTTSNQNQIINNTEISGNNEGITLSNTQNNKVSGNNITGNIWAGIWLYNATDNTLNMNSVSNNQEGIVLQNYANNNNITENTIRNNTWNGILIPDATCTGNNISLNSEISENDVGIKLYYATQTTVQENNATNNGWAGIWLYNAPNNNIDFNTVSNNQEGIVLQNYANNNNITGNNVQNNTWNGILIPDTTCSNNNISQNTVIGNNVGIDMFYATGNSIQTNNVTENRWAGIWLYNGSNNTITNGNTIKNNPEGIFIENSANVSVSDNNLENNLRNGIYISNSSQIHVTGNGSISGNQVGVGLAASSSNCTINTNNINCNTWIGVWVNNAHDSTISGNNISNTSAEGILIENNAYNITVNQNNIQNNTLHGIIIISANNNTIQNNTEISGNNIGILLSNTNGNNINSNQITKSGWIGICILDTSLENQILSNNITTNPIGIRIDTDTSTNQVYLNSITNNTECQLRYAGTTNTLNAKNNWWGSNNDPGTHIEGLVNYTPWLILQVSTNANALEPGQTCTVIADLSKNNYMQTPTGNNLKFSVTFTATLGGVNPIETTSSNGIATTTFTAGTTEGTAQIDATVTGYTQSAWVEIGHIADVSIDLSVDKETANPGDTLIYTIAIHNSGPQTATQVEVHEMLPTGITVNNFICSTGSYDSFMNSWHVGSLSQDQTEYMQISATINPESAGTELMNTASAFRIGSNELDSNITDNMDSVTTHVNS